MRTTTNHPASSYGLPVAVDSHGQAYGPLDLAIRAATRVTGWTVVAEYDGSLTVRAVGNGLAVLRTPGAAQERGAWYRYLRSNRLSVERRDGRFANEFDLVLRPGSPTAAESRQDAKLLAHPYDGDWYGAIYRAD